MRLKVAVFIGVFITTCCLMVLNDSQYRLPEAPQPKLPVIFAITATYTRPTQIPDLTRLCNTLMNVPSVFWIVTEDAVQPTQTVRNLLQNCDVPSVLIAKKTDERFSNGKKHGRGVDNRNAALKWLREHVQTISNNHSIIYFADDDNAYDIRLFEEIRKTNDISMFPVGGLAKTGVSTPVIHSNGTLIGYHDPYPAKRKYLVDMAGFAVGIEIFLRSTATFPHRTGYLEDGFLRALQFNESDIQFLANGCTTIYAWHVKTKDIQPITEEGVSAKLSPFVNESNLRTVLGTYS